MVTEKATGRDSDKFMLRFPDGMRDRIADSAKENGRSMNAEIISRLDGSFLGVTEASELHKAIDEVRLELLAIAKIRRQLEELQNPTGDTDIGD